MKKLLVFTMLFCFIGSMAMADGTRVNTMGEVNNIVKDNANIWIFPQTVNEYPNLFTAEFDDGYTKSPSGDAFWKGGANFGFGEGEEAWTLGAYFSRMNFSHDYFNLGNGMNEDHRINLLYGRNLGGNPFGMNFGYYKGGSENKDTSTVANYEQSFTRYELMFGYSPMPELELSAGFNVSTWTDKDWTGTAITDVTKPDGNSEFFLMGRYWMAPRGNCTPVAHFGFSSEKQGIEYYSAGTLTSTTNETDMFFEVGMGMNYDGGSDILVVTDFGFIFNTNKIEVTPATGTATENKTSTITLPFFKIGIDAKVLSWMDLRSGVTNQWVGKKMEPTTVTERTSSMATTNTYLGAGFHWGNFEINADVSERFIVNGPDFISGDNTTDMFEQVTLLYWFN